MRVIYTSDLEALDARIEQVRNEIQELEAYLLLRDIAYAEAEGFIEIENGHLFIKEG